MKWLGTRPQGRPRGQQDGPGAIKPGDEYPPCLAYEPALLPPLERMRAEGIDVFEDWIRGAEEWSMILRVYGGITRTSAVLEIGCGQGRIAFPVRYLLSADGPYDGFDIDREKIAFLQ